MEYQKEELRKKSHFQAPKLLKYVRIYLTKEIKTYSKNCKTLMEEIEGNRKKWKDIHVHGLEEQILLKYPHYPKQSTDLMKTHPCQNTNNIFHRTRTKNTEMCMEPQRTLNSQSNLVGKKKKIKKAKLEASQFQTSSSYITKL